MNCSLRPQGPDAKRATLSPSTTLVWALGLLAGYVTPLEAMAQYRRPDIYSFTFDQRSQLRTLILNYLQNSGAHKAHGLQFDTDFDLDPNDPNKVHSGPSFLCWHREFIAGLEAYLQTHGGSDFVPCPKWNPNDPIPCAFRGEGAMIDNRFAPPVVCLKPLDCICPGAFGNLSAVPRSHAERGRIRGFL